MQLKAILNSEKNIFFIFVNTWNILLPPDIFQQDREWKSACTLSRPWQRTSLESFATCAGSAAVGRLTTPTGVTPNGSRIMQVLWGTGVYRRELTWNFIERMLTCWRCDSARIGQGQIGLEASKIRKEVMLTGGKEIQRLKLCFFF